MQRRDKRCVGIDRRTFLGTMAVAGAGASLPAYAVATEPASAPAREAAGEPTPPPRLQRVTLRINGAPHELMLDTRTTLLDALRNHAMLTGTKKGCDRGQCGACTVIANGRRINSCLALAVLYDRAEIVTVEGLGQGEELSALQRAFLDQDGLQCGYCTPGQLCSGTAMLDEFQRGALSSVSFDEGGEPSLSEAEIRERMSGNICRCGAYTNIVAAIQQAAKSEGA